MGFLILFFQRARILQVPNMRFDFSEGMLKIKMDNHFHFLATGLDQDAKNAPIKEFLR